MLAELKARKSIYIMKSLIDMYHAQGCPMGGGAAKGSRYFVWVIDGYWCAGIWVHDSTPFRHIANHYRIPQDNSYFIRRVCRFCPIDCLVDMLNALAQQLRREGKEALWTLGLKGHSNALYKRAGFEEVGKTVRSGHPVFVRWLHR